MIKLSNIKPGDKVFIDNKLAEADILSEKLKSINIHVTYDKAKVAQLKIITQNEIKELINTLKFTPFIPTDKICQCNEQIIFDNNPLKWENHEMGKCGFPFESCSNKEHRKIYCLNCGSLVKIAFCVHNTNSFSYDEEKGWWVDSNCGLPKKAYYDQLNSNEQSKANGSKAILYREYEQPTLDLREKLSKEIRSQELIFSSKIQVVKS